MRIIDRKTFLTMPPGTLFSKVSPWVFGPLEIKGDTVGENDFCTQQIADAINSDSSEDWAAKLELSMRTGVSLEMDFDYQGRDGCYNGDDVLFAVWERGDIISLMKRLEDCLRVCV